MSLKISQLNVHLAISDISRDHSILTNIDLEINPGELLLILGLNGSGKSSLAKTLLAHPDYLIESGKIELDGTDITGMNSSERARLGLYLAAQQPTEIPGLNLENYLRVVYNSLAVAHANRILIYPKFRKLVLTYLELLNLPKEFLKRNLNEGFSGGEKKKLELLQILVFQPKYIILDELDSGLDVRASKLAFSLLEKILKQPETIWPESKNKPALILISHNLRVNKFLKPVKVVIIEAGKIKAAGGPELIKQFA